MAEKDKKFYWIKLKKEFMEGETIDFLMSQKNGANYVVLYQMLILKTINTQGKLCSEIGEVLIPFDPDKIQRDCKWFDIDTVRVAMELYAKLGLIYKNEDGIIQIANFENIVGSETYWAKQKRLQQDKSISGDEDFKYIKKISYEQFELPNGDKRFIDEKRYGGNGMKVWDRSQGKCEICGSTDNLCLHHNNGYSNAYEDLVVICKSCHREIEEGKKSWKFSNHIPTKLQHPLISSIYNLNSESFNIFDENVKTSILQWIQYKKEKKQTYKDTGLETLLKKLLKWQNEFGEEYVINAIESSMASNYDGIYPEKTTPQKTATQNYPQHKYSKKELNSLFANVDEIVKGEKDESVVEQ